MSSLGYSLVAENNQVLQPNLPGGANPSGAVFTDPIPQFSSKVEAAAGCGGAGGSAASLAGNPGYNVEKKQMGGNVHRRGGKRSAHKSHKRSSHKRSSHKRSAHKRSARKSHKRSAHKRSSHKRSAHKSHKRSAHKRRSMRGGLSALAPSSFSGAANLPYHQFTGNQPLSFNYGLGSSAPLPPADSGLANPPPLMNIQNNCGSDYGLVSKGLLN